MVSSWVRYAYFNNEQIISINVVLMNATYGYQYHLDQYLVKQLLERKYIQVEGAIYVQKQLQYMDQLLSLN